MIKVGVFGASGYTGFETIKLLRQHPEIELVFATSESSAGGTMADIYPVPWHIPLIASESAPLDEVDAVFCCLPHAASMPTVQRARAVGVRVIDLSADFRLTDTAVYQKWYKVEHSAPELLAEAVYGLPEVYRAQVAQTDLVANPGCYPTSINLALYPLLMAGKLDFNAPIIADSKSGVSGAGRKLRLNTHFVEANENLSPYSIGQNHRHMAEIEALLYTHGGPSDKLIFSPHLVPISRGMLSTIYVTLTEEMADSDLHQLFEETYADSPLTDLLPLGQLATMAHTQRTNRCVLSLTHATARQWIICASIDNLGKGASGQAVQNFNLMFGLNEAEGLL